MRPLLGSVRRHLGAACVVAFLALLLLVARGSDLLAGLTLVAALLLVRGLVRPDGLAPLVRRRSRPWNAALAGALLLVPLLPLVARAETLRAVADAVIDAGLPPGAAVYVVQEEFPAGSELVIEPEAGEPLRVRLDEAAHFAIADLEPYAKFGHAVRSVLVPVRGGPLRVFAHESLPAVNGLDWAIDAEIEHRGHAVLGLTDSRVPFPRLRAEDQRLPAIAAAAAAGRRVALVVDGGHLQHDWRDRFARKLDEDSRAVAGALEDLGYEVRRYGGYRGSVVPAPRPDDIRRELARIAREVSPGDEVVIYLNGHGTAGGDFVTIGRDGARGSLAYRALADALLDIPTTVPVRVIIDSCYSGAAVAPLSRRENTVVSTATDASRTAPGGLGNERTFSDVFAAAVRSRASDLDGDGRVSLDEALVAADATFDRLGATLVATRGAPPLPVAARSPGPGPSPSPAPPTAAPTAAPTPTASPPPTAPASPTLAVVSLPPPAGPLVFRGADPPSGVAGQPYPRFSFCLPAPATATSACGPFPATTDPTGGSPPYHFQLGSGVGFPPVGMSLGKDGLLTGTPGAPGTYVFEVCAVDLSATQACRRVSLVVAPAAPVPTAVRTPAPTVAPTRTVSPPTTGAVTSRSCAHESGSGNYTYYTVSVAGTVSGPVGSRVAYVNSTMTCPGWTPFGPDCRRTAESQPASISWSATRRGVLGGVAHQDLWLEGPGPPYRQNLTIRCP